MQTIHGTNKPKLVKILVFRCVVVTLLVVDWLCLVVTRYPVTRVSGWGVYCQASVGFLLLPVAPSVSCSFVDALLTRSSKLPPSPAFSQCPPMSTTCLSFLPNHNPQLLINYESSERLLPTRLPWGAFLRAFVLICRDNHIKQTSLSFLSTVLQSWEIFVVAFSFVLLGAILGNALFYSTYDANVISENMDDYRRLVSVH